MTVVSANNKAWSILTHIRDSLIAATVDTATVFDQVSITTNLAQGRDILFCDNQVAIVLFDRLVQQDNSNLSSTCQLKLRLFLAAKADSDSARVDRALRLVCIAKNILETDPPPDAIATLSRNGRSFHAPIEWGEVKLDSSDRSPWGVCELPLEITFQIATRTEN